MSGEKELFVLFDGLCGGEWMEDGSCRRKGEARLSCFWKHANPSIHTGIDHVLRLLMEGLAVT